MHVSEPGITGGIESSLSSSGAFDSANSHFRASSIGWLHRLPQRRWLHLLLLALTFVTTTVFGCVLAASFFGQHALGDDFIEQGWQRLAHGGPHFWDGILYSVPLLFILLAHEFGHYTACERWGVDASLPYFGPSPLLLGTFGAFIRIRTPIYSRKSLFDIGIWGPLTGFVLLLPFLFVGIALSRVVPGIGTHATFSFGTPLLIRLAEMLRFPGTSAADVSLHPMAMAAWAGLLATAINLLPIGQLDGGHISYALLGEQGHRVLSLALVAILAVAGFLYWPWWVWAVVLFFFRRHPLIYDQAPLDRKRQFAGALALLLFLLSICIVPVQVK